MTRSNIIVPDAFLIVYDELHIHGRIAFPAVPTFKVMWPLYLEERPIDGQIGIWKATDGFKPFPTSSPLAIVARKVDGVGMQFRYYDIDHLPKIPMARSLAHSKKRSGVTQ